MTCRLLATVTLVVVCTLPVATARGQCTTQWVRTGGVPGVALRGPNVGENEIVNGTTLWDPDGAGPLTPRLAMVGFFDLAGTVLSPKVAAWDPATGDWSAIAPSSFSSGGNTSCVLGLPNGDLVVGGFFATVNNVPMSCIARWNGSTWSPLGAGLNGEVRSLARLPNGDLVAAGYFSASGGVVVNGVARWNGVAWSPLGSGLTGSSGSGIGRALAVLPNGDLVVGGSFTAAGGVAAGNIARWNGTTWSPLGPGLPPLTTFNGVEALAAAPNGDVVAGGTFTTSGGAPVDYLGRWNGTTWSTIGGSVNSLVRSVAFAANGDLFVGGVFTTIGGQPANRVARWNGSVWSPVAGGVTPTGSNGGVFAMTELPGGDMVVAGRFTAAGGALHAVRWNGTTLSPLSPGTNQKILASTTLANGDLVVAGDFTMIAGTSANRIARRTATGWVPLGSGCSGSVLAVVGLPNGDLVAAGVFATAGGVTVNGVARWDGTTWSAMGSGLSGGGDAYALAALPNGDVVLGGSFTTIGGVAVNSLARWNGSTWAAFGGSGPGAAGYLRALAVMPNGDLVAGGGFTTAGGVAANNIARWNGTSWSAFGSGVSAFFVPSVTALLPLPNGQLIAGGRFQSAGSAASNGVARWNGTNWVGLGTGVDPMPGTAFTFDVLALALLPNGDIAVGGGFPSASGVPSANLVRWNGSTWSAFGTGTDGQVDALRLLPSGELAVGGWFLAVDGGASAFLAYRTATCPATALAVGSGCTGSAGPNSLTAATLPWLGGTCRAVASGCPASSLVIAAFGLGTASVPLPSLLPQGVAGCSLLVSPDVLATVVPSGGSAAIDLVIPNAAVLIGGVVHEQALPFELGPAGLLALTSSNALTLSIGVF